MSQFEALARIIRGRKFDLNTDENGDAILTSDTDTVNLSKHLGMSLRSPEKKVGDATL